MRVWYAPEEARGGEKIYDQIDRATQLHDRLLLVLSANSIKSVWVTTEIHRARKAGLKEQRRKLFPIRLVDFETIRGRARRPDPECMSRREIRMWNAPRRANSIGRPERRLSRQAAPSGKAQGRRRTRNCHPKEGQPRSRRARGADLILVRMDIRLPFLTQLAGD